MSSKGQQRYSQGQEQEISSYIPRTATKSVVLNRTSIGGGGLRGSRTSVRNSGIGGINAQVLSKISSDGIHAFQNERTREKADMQDLNERFASYIEKVRWLEAQNAKLEAELEALRNRKQEDWKPIREMYEGELNQARNVIAELSTQKGVSEGKLANLEDQILSLKDLIAQYDANAKDYVKKIDQLNSQVGEYEGELTTLRLRVGSLEDEVAKLRALIDKYKNENMRLRADLDAETAAHIEQEVLAQTKTEECEFLQELLDKLNLMQQEPIKVKGKDMELYFKGELRNAIAECQRMYDDRLATTIEELENKYSLQMDQLRTGNVRDTMETEHAKSEIKRLRDQLSERNARLAELEAALAAMRAERDNLKMRYSDLEQDFEREKIESSRKITELQMQVEALMQQLNELIDAKMSLELEIACYKKLLEGEESRTGLRSLVEQALGTTGSGGSALQDIIGGQSS